MPTTSKSNKKATAAITPEFVDAFTPLVLNSVERVADLQKKSLDVAAEQTAELIGAWKKAFSFFPVTPPAFFFDFAGQAVQTAVEAQKSAIDMVVEQTEAVTDINKVRVEAYSKIVNGVTTSVQQSVERSMEAQKKMLAFASAQTKAGVDSAKKQLGTAAGPATAILDTFQLGADTMIEAQKSFLNMASQPFVSNARN
jgi:hypothetical protein